MITIQDYFGKWNDHPAKTLTHVTNAQLLISRVNDLLAELLKTRRIDLDINPTTKTLVSGEQYGGWRPPECPIGAPRSAHKTGEAIDIYDADGDIDGAIDDPLLRKHGLYREHPSATRSWCHLTTRAPKSGRRSFYP
jgi:hypothetical protein